MCLCVCRLVCVGGPQRVRVAAGACMRRCVHHSLRLMPHLSAVMFSREATRVSSSPKPGFKGGRTSQG